MKGEGRSCRPGFRPESENLHFTPSVISSLDSTAQHSATHKLSSDVRSQARLDGGACTRRAGGGGGVGGAGEEKCGKDSSVSLMR